MPLYSVSKYVQGLINGLPLPAGLPALEAWITPPVLEEVDGPKAHVWGGRVKGGRQTAPRGTGFRKLPWQVDVYLVYMDTPDDALTYEPFPQVIDTVISVFTTTTMPLFIDASGNVMGPNAVNKTDTQIQAIGETWELEYPPERVTASMLMVWYVARLGLDVLEVQQG